VGAGPGRGQREGGRAPPGCGRLRACVLRNPKQNLRRERAQGPSDNDSVVPEGLSVQPAKRELVFCQETVFLRGPLVQGL
jgi:hypothetical protein